VSFILRGSEEMARPILVILSREVGEGSRATPLLEDPSLSLRMTRKAMLFDFFAASERSEGSPVAKS